MIKNILLILFSLGWMVLAEGTSLNTTTLPITDYHATWIPTYDQKGNLEIAIRLYYQGNVPYFLLVNPYTLDTKSAPVAESHSRKIINTTPGTPGYYTQNEIQNTPYVKALFHYSSPPFSFANDGLIHAAKPVHGQFLTIDMCPSSKPFEAEFFKKLVALADQSHHATPIGLSMSGLWMITHPDEFQWLIHQEQTNKLNITWINHSFSHVYYADAPPNNNFLLKRPSDLSNEVLETEKILLQNQQRPSIYFRAPGLMTNKEIILKLREMGLILLGSDAWLAKGEQPKEGSIILVHGNSNEHRGIELIMLLLQHNHLPFLPLAQAF